MSNLFGISIEVYFILIILGLPFFFIFRRLFRKKIGNKTNRIISIWVATIFATPIFYALLAWGIFSIMTYYPNRDFNKKEWLINKETRYEYSKDIIDSELLIGKTKVQVKVILGDVRNLDSEDTWYYDLGFKPEIGNIDPDVLMIEFKNGLVIKVSQHNT